MSQPKQSTKGEQTLSSSETLQNEMGRVNKMTRLPQFKNLRGAKSFVMKHHGGAKRVK